jgi:hypothetical protein
MSKTNGLPDLNPTPQKYLTPVKLSPKHTTTPSKCGFSNVTSISKTFFCKVLLLLLLMFDIVRMCAHKKVQQQHTEIKKSIK